MMQFIPGDALEHLELNKILDLLQNKAVSEEARNSFVSPFFFVNARLIEDKLNEVAECKELIELQTELRYLNGTQEHTRVFYGSLSLHNSSVGLILNPNTHRISPQYHCIYDDYFETVGYDSTTKPPSWDDLVIEGFSSNDVEWVPEEEIMDTWEEGQQKSTPVDGDHGVKLNLLIQHLKSKEKLLLQMNHYQNNQKMK